MREPWDKKRRFPRHEVGGDTRIRPNGGWKTLGNALSQISLGGCYLLTPEPYPEGTELDLQLEVGGHPLQVHGIVIYAHPARGMGVAFQQTPEEEQALKELLDSMGKSLPPA